MSEPEVLSVQVLGIEEEISGVGICGRTLPLRRMGKVWNLVIVFNDVGSAVVVFRFGVGAADFAVVGAALGDEFVATMAALAAVGFGFCAEAAESAQSRVKERKVGGGGDAGEDEAKRGHRA